MLFTFRVKQPLNTPRLITGHNESVRPEFGSIILVDDHSNSGEDRSHLTFFRAKLFKGLGDHTGHSAQNFTDGNILQFNFYSCFDTRIDTRIKLQFSIHFLWFVWVHFLFTPLCYQCGSLETYKISYLHKSPVSHPKCLV